MELVLVIVAGVFSAGGAWAGVLFAIRSLREADARQEKRLDNHEQRLYAIETRRP